MSPGCRNIGLVSTACPPEGKGPLGPVELSNKCDRLKNKTAQAAKQSSGFFAGFLESKGGSGFVDMLSPLKTEAFQPSKLDQQVEVVSGRVSGRPSGVSGLMQSSGVQSRLQSIASEIYSTPLTFNPSRYLSKVYLAVVVSIMVCALSCRAGMRSTSLFGSSGTFGFIALLIMGAFLALRNKVGTGAFFARLIAFQAFLVLTGLSSAPFMKSVYALGAPAVNQVAVFTLVGFAVVSYLNIKYRSQSLINRGQALTIFLAVSFALALLNFKFVNLQVVYVHVWLTFLGAVAFTVYDTQSILARAGDQQPNVILHAFELFMDIFLIFRCLVIIRIGGKL